jgi:hypothetical protein
MRHCRWRARAKSRSLDSLRDDSAGVRIESQIMDFLVAAKAELVKLN